MRSPCSRRQFLGSTVMGAVAAPLAARRSSASTATSPLGTTPRVFLDAFEYDGVRLLDGMLKRQFDTARSYYFNIPDDDLLKGFRARAGLAAPGNEMGGWYSGDPKRRTWWAAGDTFNTFGQFLSGMARMSKAAGDSELARKASGLMLEWAKTVEADGYFYYSRKPWLPHYIYDKTVCGLVDLCLYAGRRDALPLLSKITDWASLNLDRSRKPDDNGEWYTLSENLYRAYELTGDARYRTFGDVWRFTDYWNAFNGGQAMSRHGHHAYSHVNTLSGAAMAYSVSGDSSYLDTIVHAYDWLHQTQCFATGGFGPDEDLVAPDGELGRRLDTTYASFETPCGSWAGFKLSRYLLRFTGDARYGDWIERLLYNGIGVALPMGPKGQTFYYSDYRIGGARKIYHLDGTWPCCSGTYPQVVADYYNVIYFKDGDGLFVNLFVPSQVTWNQGGDEVTLEQETSYPESDTTTLSVRLRKASAFSVRFRVPLWSKGARIALNGESLSIATQPGTWANIQRTWNPGDRITIQIPMTLMTVPVDTQHPKRVAFMNGPVVLVQNVEPVVTAPGPDPASAARRSGTGLEFSLGGQHEARLVPLYAIGAGTPYNMYFDIRG